MDKINLAEFIEEEYGQNVHLCYQCKKCTAGCPLVYEMDWTPTQIIHAIRLGMKDLVLNSETIWLCASCQTCTTRCPHEIDIAKVMDAARIVSRKLGIKPKSGVAKFYKLAVQNIKFFGRMYEPLLFGMTNLWTGKPTKDLKLGREMFKKGKLKVIPSLKGNLTMGIFSKVKKKEKI
jgi:heterodisulfide reductase subunit C